MSSRRQTLQQVSVYLLLHTQNRLHIFSSHPQLRLFIRVSLFARKKSFFFAIFSFFGENFLEQLFEEQMESNVQQYGLMVIT